jgi:hypothetical protein
MRLKLIAFTALVVLAGGGWAARADTIAYASLGHLGFGTMDFTTGTFTQIGPTVNDNDLAGLAVLGSTLYGMAYNNPSGSLYSINTTTGVETAVGTPGVRIDEFGSTTTTLYGVDSTGNLYSISTSGAATLIGNMGIPVLGTVNSLSSNGTSLFFSNNSSFYSVNTSTGAATEIGSAGSLGVLMSSMLFEGGTLYGEDVTVTGPHPNPTIDTINPLTGTDNGVFTSQSTTNAFVGLAPFPIPSGTSTPEPGTWAMLAGGVLLVVLRRRRARS